MNVSCLTFFVVLVGHLNEIRRDRSGGGEEGGGGGEEGGGGGCRVNNKVSKLVCHFM